MEEIKYTECLEKQQTMFSTRSLQLFSKIISVLSKVRAETSASATKRVLESILANWCMNKIKNIRHKAPIEISSV